MIRFAAAFCSLVLFACSGWAQEVTGTIVGTIQDASGAFVPGAPVSVTNTDKKVLERTAVSGANGEYVATLLPIGHYTIAVEAKGFKKATKINVELNVNDKLTVNFTLEVGAVTEEVTVQANVTQVDTQTQESSTLISGTQVRELALNTRNYAQLVTLQPGVSTGGNDQLYVGVSAPAGTSNQMQFAINGARISANNWTIDGADNVDRGGNLTLLNYPSVDAIAEFKVLRGLYTAEFGRGGGGQINVITKSGGSAFHGDAYEFLRNDKLAANNFFNNARSVNLGTDGKARVPPLRYNNFGYTIGGPVYIPRHYNTNKNKTFFFFSEEFRRVVTYSSVSGNAPTAGEKQGIFATPVCIAYSAAGACTATGTQIPSINPVAAGYIKDIFSKVPDAPANNLLFTALRNVFNARQELAKIDHVFSQKLSVSGRFLNDDIPTIEPGGLFTGSALPGVSTTSTNSPGRSWTIRATSSFSPTWLNEGGYFYSYGAVLSTVSGLVNTNLSPDVKVTLPFATTLGRIPALTFPGGGSITGFGPYLDYNRNHTVFDNMTKVLGRHTVKFGFSYNHYQKTENEGRANAGNFSFTATGAPTGTSSYKQQFANFLLGNVSSFTQNSADFMPDIRANQVELYVQDDFRIRPNFTINAGARYSLFRSPYEANAHLTNFDPALYDPAKAPQIDRTTGNIIPGTGDYANGNTLNGIIINGQGSPYGSKIANENYKNVAPRFGFSWDPFGDGKTAIRSGYGMYFDTPLYGSTYENNVFNNPPFLQGINIPNTRLDNPGASTPSVSLAPKTIYATPLPYSTPYTQQWSFDIQREIARDFIVDIGYLGSKGTHLIGIVDLNEVYPGVAAANGVVAPGTFVTSATTPRLNYLRPYRGFGPIRAIETWFNSNYNSLQFSAHKRFSGSTRISADYTFSKNLTDNRSDTGSAPQNTYNRAAERGLAQYDRRHVFSLDYVWELPFFKEQKGLTGHLLGGWEISGITQFGSGLPLNVTSSLGNDPAGLGIIGASPAGPRPDWLCNPNVNAPHTVAQWFNTSCFAEVPAGQNRPGNAGRSLITGPGYERFDVSLIRNFKIAETASLQLRGEAFNVLNHVNFFNFDSALGSGTYGQVTSARDPRIIQIGAKLYF